MRANRVVMPSPAFDEDSCLLQSVEDFSIEKLIAQLAVEAYIISVLPWAAWFDVKCFDTDTAQPVTHSVGGKLCAIV